MPLHLQHEHPWDVSPAAAIAIQMKLRRYLIMTDQFDEIETAAGVDVGFEQAGGITRAAVVVLGFPSLELKEKSIARLPTSFPYVPGLLSFRELPSVLAALERLRKLPDLLLCDGQGYAHPRRLGIASHLGLLTGIPSIGVGKTRLLGTHAAVADIRGTWQPLMDKDEVIGAVLRTRQGVKPIYVSTGHRVSLATAICYVMACTTRYKLPETTRLAHRYASHP
ncbi:MAG: Endonuclease V [Gammaproteobacteria bacterium]|nr:Endonuclease V [Gammaproteobacteria bacterium]